MKIKSNYILRTVAGQHLVVPVGEEGVNFNGIITLNNSGKLLFEALLEGCEKNVLVERMLEVYEVSEDQATSDVDAFVELLKTKKLLEE